MENVLVRSLNSLALQIAEFGLSHADDFPLDDNVFLPRLVDCYDNLLSAISNLSVACDYYDQKKKDL